MFFQWKSWFEILTCSRNLGTVRYSNFWYLDKCLNIKLDIYLVMEYKTMNAIKPKRLVQFLENTSFFVREDVQ